jgi:hypothetical protein
MVFEIREAKPAAVLFLPVVLALSERVPNAELKKPVVLEFRD